MSLHDADAADDGVYYVTSIYIISNDKRFMMRKEDEERLRFYKNGSADNVLQRYMFTEEERKLIEDAIRTSKKEYPRMKLIERADELLKEVAKTREPRRTGNSNEFEKAKGRVEASMVTVQTDKKPGEVRVFPLYMGYFIGLVIAMLFYELFFAHTGWYKEEALEYTYDDAQQICKEKNASLPTAGELLALSRYSNKFYQWYLYLTNDNYWVLHKSGPYLIYNTRSEKTKAVNPEDEYEVKCIYTRW